MPGVAGAGRVIAALFVHPRGCYLGLPDVDPWPESRDARAYAGPWPVVAHPPCSSWSMLAPVNAARWGRAVGADGGCFAAALAAVRRFGGVLEHPAESRAWPAFGLSRPFPGAWTRGLFDPGWVTEVSQSAYGHPARKETWLYYVGEAPPPLIDWSSPPPTACVSYMVNHRSPQLPRLTKVQAQATPPAFRDLLLSLARSARRQAAA